MRGYFENNRLYLELAISGLLKQDGRVVKAHVDTGYDGELTMPLNEAFPFGCALVGAKDYIFMKN